MDWTTLQQDWSAVQAQWDAAWREAQAQAIAAWNGTAAQAESMVADFLADLAGIDEDLDWMEAQVALLPSEEAQTWRSRIAAWRKTWLWLGAGIYPYVTTGWGVQGAPAGAVVVGVVGVAFAAAFWEYAAYLRDDVALSRLELEARIEAMRTGRTLQPTTLSKPAGGTSDAPTLGGVLLVGGALLALGAGVTWALRR